MIGSESGKEISKPFGKYVLVSAARNEEKYIERTIQAVIAQSYLPVQWIILSDGSIDRTDDIVQWYALRNSFMKLIRIQSDAERNFGSKARAINTGYDNFKGIRMICRYSGCRRSLRPRLL